MKYRYRDLIVLSATLVAGCARLEFSEGWTTEGAHFYDPVPHILVTVGKDCTTSAAVTVLPGPKRTVSFHNGYGTANLSAAFQNGLLSSAGQQTDSKIPETITSLTGLATAIPKLAAAVKPGAVSPPPTCAPKALLFNIGDDGQVDPAQKPVQLTIPD